MKNNICLSKEILFLPKRENRRVLEIDWTIPTGTLQMSLKSFSSYLKGECSGDRVQLW